MPTTQYWRMGATPVPATATARALEAASWDGLALGEAHGLLPDPYALIGACAGATTHLKLGSAVAVPIRHPLLAADAMATVHALTGGRTRFSVGRGDGAMKVLRREPMRVAQFEQYLRALMGYLRREEVEFDGAVTSMSRLDDIDPSLDMTPPPVSVAATGPRTIAVAARWADGIDFSVGADPGRLAASMTLARDSAATAGRDPDGLQFGCFLQMAVVDDQADLAEAVRGLIITHARFSGNFSSEAARVMEGIYADARGGTQTSGRPGEIAFYPEHALAREEVRRFGIIDTPQRCAERLGEIAALGFEHIYIGTRAVGVDLDEINALRIGREVLPAVR